ncbi:MAG: phosphopantetheine-binding protein [Veillonellaceae bacterium]|nr:phosphopantetheine-binding protein [Veillonellaceae bacterium]MDD6924463.1 phosphopantetheine-binding protein [Veillonellaceae bacterium]
MTNIEKYNQAFVDAFDIDEKDAESMEFNKSEGWDSVGQMKLVAAFEDAFDIMLETEDIIGINSYNKGKEVLSEKYDIKF